MDFKYFIMRIWFSANVKKRGFDRIHAQHDMQEETTFMNKPKNLCNLCIFPLNRDMHTFNL